MDYKSLINKALAAGFSDCEVYAYSQMAMTISIFNQEVDKNEIHDTKNYSVRGIYNGKMAYLSFEDEQENEDYIIQTLKDNASVLTTLEEFEIFTGSNEYPEIKKIDSGFRGVDVTSKIELLMSLEKEVKAYDKRITQVPYCRYNEIIDSVHIINSKGLDVRKGHEYAYMILEAVAKDNDQSPQIGYDIDVVLKYEDFDAIKLAQKVAKKAISMLNASPVASKKYPIVFDREAMGDLFGVFSSMFSGEQAIKKLTPLIGKEGEKIFSEKVTIIDDPLYEEAVSKEPFDDEGVACYKKTIVKNGVFQGMLHNLKTAKYFKKTTTGNGFKSGAGIGVSGTNLYIDKGEKSREELIASMEEGLLITDLSGLHAGANSITGDFSCQSSGFLIKNGKIDRPVTLIVVSGNFFKIMNEIEDIGNDLKIFHNGLGTPSIKFIGLPVSGK